MPVKPLELVLVGIASLIVWFILASYALGGPLSSDVTWYMNVGLNNIEDTFILNRYFHVFLQKIFLELAPTPLAGFQIFWAFLIALTIFLIYFCARVVTDKSSPIHAILAVMIFISMPALAEISGIVYVDVTAMAMMMVILTIYLLSARQEHRNPWLVGLLGFSFFLAFKTKETTLTAGVLLIGLGFCGGKNFKWPAWLKNIGWLLAGVFCGILLFALLNWIFLGDPLFGLRFMDLQKYLLTYVQGAADAQKQSTSTNWYAGYWFKYLLIPFIFYIISGVKASGSVNVSRRLVWLVPLAFILFIIVSINNQWGYQSRFILPALPVLSMLGPQFINIEIPASRGDRLKLGFSLLISIIVIIGVRLLMRAVIPQTNWELGLFIELVFHPVLLTLMLAIIFISVSTFWASIVNLILLVSLMVSPIISNAKLMFIRHPNFETFTNEISPLSAFAATIQYSPAMRFYADSRVLSGENKLGIIENVDELLCMFNIFFDASATRLNFNFAFEPAYIASDILGEHYDYALLTQVGWLEIQSRSEAAAQIEQLYQPFFEERGLYVLLKAR